MTTTDSVAQRITSRMNELNIKGVDITRATGATSGTISLWKSGVNVPGAKYLLPLAEILQCDPDWLLYGTEGTTDEASALPLIPQQKHVAELDEKYPPTDSHIRIMRYDAIASAGGGNADWVIRENDDDPLYFRRNWFKARHLNPDNLRAMYVRGDSMEPYLYNHDTIIVDASDTEIMDGDVYAIMYRKRRYVKELRNHVDGISIISRNEKYAPMLVNFEDIKSEQDFCVLGKVVWRGG